MKKEYLIPSVETLQINLATAICSYPEDEGEQVGGAGGLFAPARL